jgi:hypothetical protein
MASERATKESLQQSIIDALSYARTVLRSYIELESCPHDGLYNGRDGTCLACPQRLQCEWLYSNEAFAALDKKPFAEILAALEDGFDYLDVQIRLLGHDSRRCKCSTCAWLRNTQRLAAEARALSPASVRIPRGARTTSRA